MHEYFNVRIRREIAAADRRHTEPTFSGGDFAPDLINKLKEHLRKIELAQLRAVQEYKEVIRAQVVGGRPRGKIWQQIEKARSKT